MKLRYNGNITQISMLIVITAVFLTYCSQTSSSPLRPAKSESKHPLPLPAVPLPKASTGPQKPLPAAYYGKWSKIRHRNPKRTDGPFSWHRVQLDKSS